MQNLHGQNLIPTQITDEFGRITNFFMMHGIYCVYGVILTLDEHIGKRGGNKSWILLF